MYVKDDSLVQNEREPNNTKLTFIYIDGYLDVTPNPNKDFVRSFV